MPIDVEYLRNNKEAAVHFVQSQDGLILNVVARAVAASRTKIHGGHLIIHRDLNKPTGSFVISPRYKDRFEATTDHKLSRISGLLSELFFCNAPSVARSIADLHAVVSIDHPFNAVDRDQSVAIKYIHQQYGNYFHEIAPAVQSNYYLAQHFVSLGDFLIKDYHVIPSCILEPFCGPTGSDRIMHYLSTRPLKKRSEALKNALNNPQMMLPNSLG